MADDELTRLERLKRQVTDNKVGAFVAAALVVIAAVGGAVGSVQAIFDLFKSSPEPAVKVAQEDLGLVANPRYGFKFKYPLSWERMDPENGDGTRFVGDEPGVEIVAYGYAENTAEFEDLDQRTIAQVSDGTIVKQPVTQLATRLIDEQSAEEVEGRRVLVRFAAAKPDPAVTALVFTLHLKDHGVTIRCQAPTAQYTRYAGLCTQLIGTLTLTR